MRIITLAISVLLLSACSQTSLTLSHTGEITAVIKTTGSQNIEAVVTEMKEAMKKACEPGKLKLAKKAGAAGFVKLEQDIEKVLKLLGKLAGWLPSYSVTLQGYCVRRNQ